MVFFFACAVATFIIGSLGMNPFNILTSLDIYFSHLQCEIIDHCPGSHTAQTHTHNMICLYRMHFKAISFTTAAAFQLCTQIAPGRPYNNLQKCALVQRLQLITLYGR